MRRGEDWQTESEGRSMRHGFGAVPVVGALLVGCVLSGCWGAAADSTSNGSGGANVGANVGAGGSAGGGPATGGSASGGAGASTSGAGGTPTGTTMTQEEWEAATAPRSGPHEIWTRDDCGVPHAGSDSTRVGQEYRIVPGFAQSTPPDFDLYTNPVFLIDVSPSTCTTAADCTEQPNGLCMGGIAEPYCRYSDPPPREACDEDADCTAKPDGACEAPFGLEQYTICYPTGECQSPAGSCVYGTHPRCASHADCTEGAGGECIFPVTAGCNYDSCTGDADCEGGLRCGCGRCVEAHCASDEACGEGETCDLSPPFCRGDYEFFCTTPGDECSPGEPLCIYQEQPSEGRWRPTGRCTL